MTGLAVVLTASLLAADPPAPRIPSIAQPSASQQQAPTAPATPRVLLDDAPVGTGVARAAAAPARAVDPNAPDTLVVCPAAFREALRPWLAYRASQGRRITLAEPPRTAGALRDSIRSVAASSALRWVVLVGDAGSEPGQVPTCEVPAKVNIHWGSEPEIATDNPFADLDDDDLPDVAIGRLPADTPADLSRLVEKILRYEREAGHGPWRRQVNLVAGVGGFGFVDTILETITKQFLTQGIPAEYHTTMTYGSWQSPFCPPPPLFHSTTMERLREGSLFWVYIGHGHRHGLDRVSVPDGAHHILDVRDMKAIAAERTDAAHGGPIAVMLACYTGAYDDPRDCLAEELLRSDGGPVAAIAGSRVTMPYAMSLLGLGMIHEYFGGHNETLGEVFQRSKRGLVELSDEDRRFASTRQLVDTLARALSPKADLIAEERREHLALFNLLGDPLLATSLGAPVALQVAERAKAGGPLAVRGECATPGRLRLELVCRRDLQRVAPPRRPEYDASPMSLDQFAAAYRDANDPCWLIREYQFSGGEFSTEIEIPAECQGACFIRVFVEGERGHALGAAPVEVER